MGWLSLITYASMMPWSLIWPQRYKVVILMSDTGGGHRASANALREALEKKYPRQFDIEIYDIWTEVGKWPLNKFVASYRYLGRRPWLWRLLWYGTANFWTRGPIRTWHAAAHRSRFQRALRDRHPDLVVSVHPLCQHVPLSALDGKTPFVTVVTDLGSAHPMWFDWRADLVFVPNDKVAKLARFHGVPRDRIKMHGLPLRASFFRQGLFSWHARRQRRLKSLANGWRGPCVLVVGGGDGVGGLKKIVQHVLEALRKFDGSSLTVICGRNDKLRRDLADAFVGKSNVAVKVTGFVPNIHDLMADADVLLTKAGPGTIAEAASLGLPLVLTNFLPGQERGNARLVVQSGFGALEKRPRRAARLVCDWIADPAKLATMSHNAFAAAKPDSTTRIADDIAHLAFHGRS